MGKDSKSDNEKDGSEIPDDQKTKVEEPTEQTGNEH
jgi:hypothetical protein